MKKKRFLAAILLGVILCFVVSGVGFGEEFTVEEGRKIVYKQKATDLDLYLLASSVNYIMENPNDFLDITCSYTTLDITSVERVRYNDLNLPEDFVIKDKLFIEIRDHRGVSSGKTSFDLLEPFIIHLLRFFNGSILGAFFSYPSDIVAIFYSEEGNVLGYFYQDVFQEVGRIEIK